MSEKTNVDLMYNELKHQAAELFGVEEAAIIDKAFNNCSNLEVYCKPLTPPTLGTDMWSSYGLKISCTQMENAESVLALERIRVKRWIRR